MSEIDAPLEADRLGREAPVQASGELYRVEVKDSTTSTSDDARALAAAGAPEGTVVFAEEQAAGRGRRGNIWMAPPGRSLLFSLLLRPEFDPALWPRVTHLAALAVCRAIEPFVSPAIPSLKWPNDVLIDGRKVSGILLESIATDGSGSLVLGVGINVNLDQSDFPAELRSSATSLRQEAGRPIDRTDVAVRFFKEFSSLYPIALEPFDRALEEVHQRSFLVGKSVTLNHSGRQETGRVTGFGPNGELKLVSDDAAGGTERCLSSGELVRIAESPPLL